MPFYHRTYNRGELQFITSSTYRRAPLFFSERFRRCFVQRLEEVRQELKFMLIGWVLMPEHFHLLIKPQPAESTPDIMKGLKEVTAERILKTLRRNLQHAWCQKMLARLRLPGTVHDESRYRLWQRRFYLLNVYTEKKRLEKLTYMHNNPVKRRLVSTPGEWPWSSWRFYFLNRVSTGFDPPHGPVRLTSRFGRSQGRKC
ncbi:MAG TPA: transposase [Terriglobia bacterium]|nr:transposase [Terriglobia bacterium]